MPAELAREFQESTIARPLAPGQLEQGDRDAYCPRAEQLRLADAIPAPS